MKKVRLALGAAGLAPAAVALVGMPTTPAVAAPTHQVSARGQSKTVRLTSGPAVNGHVLASGSCTGGTGVKKYSSYGWQEFWFTPHGNSFCIGTIKRHFSTSIRSNTKLRYRIWRNNTMQLSHVQDITAGGPGKNYSDGVHHSFYETTSVCTAVYNKPLSKWSAIICGDTYNA